jgi:2-dehydropantoate 2-reductase
MQVTICGAGAIGGYTGASLARAGHDVVLVDAADAHVAAINAQGLTIDAPGTASPEWTVRVPALMPHQWQGTHDLVLLSVKSQHTAVALDTIVPRLSPGGTVVALQNGLNEELIAARLGAARTVGCLVNLGADWQAPGRIQWGGPGAIVLGELDGAVTPRVTALAQLLAAAGETTITQNLWGVKWSKHVYGALLFATALVDATVYEVVDHSTPVQRMLAELVCESMDVADAAGIRLEAFDEYDPHLYRRARAGDPGALAAAMELVAHHYRTRTKTKTGVWRDLAVRKRETEASFFDITLAKGEKLGVRLPLTRAMLAMVHDLEDGRRAMSWHNLEALVDVHRAAGTTV